MILERPTYFKNLDGLRAGAAFTVIFAHICFYFDSPNTPFFNSIRSIASMYGRGGNLGVTFFFIISGFLITYLMFIEQSKNGSINIIHFYIRRVLRIWPLYYATLFVGFFLYPLFIRIFTGESYQETASWVWYSLFLANYDLIYNGHSSTGILNIQWSVAVEEQFYLLWPLVFIFLNRTKYFHFLLLALVLLSELFYSAKGFENKDWEYHLGSCFRYLSFGSLVAYLCYCKTERVYYFLGKISRLSTFFIYFFCIVLMVFKSKFTGTYIAYYIYDFILMLFLSFVIVEQNFSPNSFYKIGSFRVMNWLGKISYGLYLTHTIVIVFVLAVFPKGADYVLWKFFSTIVITICISHLSYNYFEKYFLSYKKKFQRIT